MDLSPTCPFSQADHCRKNGRHLRGIWAGTSAENHGLGREKAPHEINDSTVKRLASGSLLRWYHLRNKTTRSSMAPHSTGNFWTAPNCSELLPPTRCQSKGLLKSCHLKRLSTATHPHIMNVIIQFSGGINQCVQPLCRNLQYLLAHLLVTSCWGPTKTVRSGTMSNNVCNSTINPAYADSSIGILTS
jgi:hypothetical protein